MKILNLPSGHTVKLYSSTAEMPMRVKNEFNKYLIIDAGIGGNMQDVNAHFSKLFLYLSNQSIEDATEECKNLYYSIHNNLNGFNPTYFSFAVLIHKMDDSLCDTYSEEELNDRIETLSKWGVTDGMVEEVLSEVKKKLIPN